VLALFLPLSKGELFLFFVPLWCNSLPLHRETGTASLSTGGDWKIPLFFLFLFFFFDYLLFLLESSFPHPFLGVGAQVS